VLAVALVLALLAAGCGGESRRDPPPEDPTGAPPADGGSSGGGSGGDQGGGTGGGSSGGGSSGGGTAAPVNSADGTVQIQRLDAHAECNGLVPAGAPDAVAVETGPASTSSGGPGISDGTGHVALAVRTGGGWRQWQAFTPDGRPRETFVLRSDICSRRRWRTLRRRAPIARRRSSSAPSGRLCGAVTLRNGDGACRPGPADQGWDGTVVEKDGRCSACAWRWWPRLLAR